MSIAKHQSSQRGIALLLFLFLLLSAGATVFFSAWNSNRAHLNQERKTQLALIQARDALIAFAATNKNQPGRLPCPEETAAIGFPLEGSAKGSCSNNAIVVGRLPWRTLGLDNPVDAQGETLWYVRSIGFEAAPINSDSVGQLQLDGSPNAAVALIIAPGPPLPGQSRPTPSAAAPPDVAQYLDLGNAPGPAYLSIGNPANFNDRVLPLTREQLFRSVEARVTREVRVALEQYYTINHYYPNPANFSDPSCLGTSNNSTSCLNAVATCSSLACRGRIPANIVGTAAPWPAVPLSPLRGTVGSAPDWFQKNGWRELIYYAVAPSCAEGTVNCSGTTFLQLQNPPPSSLIGLRSIVVSSGISLAGQIRLSPTDKTTLSNYLEDKNLVTPNNIFVGSPITSGTPFNDLPAWLP